MAAVVAAPAEEIAPRLRGWLHAASAPLALAAGLVLALLSTDAVTRIGSAIFVGSALANFLASAALHLGRWRPRAALLVRRLDHASIFVLIAGSYTPFTLLMLQGDHRVVLLVTAWTGAVLGITFRLLWGSAPRWLYTGLYLALGWAAIAFVGDFASFSPVGVPILLAAGGLLYSVGGLVYGLRWPNPWSGWFGFHEVFHALTVAAFAAQYAGVLVAVVHVR